MSLHISFITLNLVALVNFVIGLVVLLRNTKESTNIAFMFFVSFVGLWAVGLAGFNVATDQNTALYWSKIYYVAAMGIATSLYVFSYSYLRRERTSFRNIWPFATVSIVLSTVILAFPTFLTRRIEIGLSSNAVVLGETEYALYTLHFVIYFFLSVLILYKKLQRESGTQRIHIKLVATGVLLAGLFGMFFNLFLPWLDNYRLIWVGPQFSVIMVGFIAYGMLKHRLFDIRGLIARSLGYITVLAAIVLIYSSFVFGFLSIFFDISDSGWTERIALISSAVIVAFTYEPLKNYLNQLTSRLFYRDAYDSQVILNQLSSLLATEIDLQKIITTSSQLISNALKPTFIRFAVFKDGETYVDHLENTERKKALIRPEVDEFDDILIVRDDASRKERQFLDGYEAEILLKLRTNEETVGVILLGPKQSGTVYSKQDLDLLTISEKELAIAVQNSRYLEQIQQFNIKLQKEVDEATAELRDTNKKLKALDEAKDEFISMASHQLRTPLTSVKGYISMVMEGDAGKIEPEQKKLMSEAFASSQRMVYLIADLLNVSRLKTGKFVIEPGIVYLPDIVEEEIAQLKPTARSRRLKIRFDKPSHFPKVWLDETKIRQVIMNFIDNAIYYTKAGGEVTIRLIVRKDSLEYSVTDNGIGVPKTEQAKLFTKFFRAGNARRARPDGTGLGLYMAQRVVSAQGGSVIFESEEGKGSTFGFKFPLKSIKTKQKLLSRSKAKELPPESVSV